MAPLSLRRRLTVSAVAAVLAAGTATPALAAACLEGPAYRAAQVRQLQTEMMVTALKCNGHPTLPLSAQYNSFVNRFGGELNRNAGVLRTKYPGAQLDRLVTSMANDASMRSLGVEGYCEDQAPMFDKVMATPESQLEAVAAEMVGNRLPVSACKAKSPVKSAEKKAEVKKVAAAAPKKDAKAPAKN